VSDISPEEKPFKDSTTGLALDVELNAVGAELKIVDAGLRIVGDPLERTEELAAGKMVVVVVVVLSLELLAMLPRILVVVAMPLKMVAELLTIAAELGFVEGFAIINPKSVSMRLRRFGSCRLRLCVSKSRLP